jgi:hypothetical protein
VLAVVLGEVIQYLHREVEEEPHCVDETYIAA